MKTQSSSNAAPEGSAYRKLFFATLNRSFTYIALGLAILALDLVTGRELQFPILFILPITLSAWFRSPGLAYSLAIALPLGRMIIATFIEATNGLQYGVANALTRIAVLAFIAYLVARSARQTRELKQRIETLVTICAWSRTVQHKGEWISFEEYLLERFNIQTSHGMSPAQARKFHEELSRTTEPETPKAAESPPPE